ncbi:hypothetical protein BBI17_001135 [Phytophthora kernoviae]|uniref:TRP C-terminal domain-containing protein n=1 Tax=Phytophthora kernoviae TaxID=325452 RepID=A0A421FG05_9STRA|nr:hypothetical protein JM16_001063 [Phytophthora kernoviae]KAG2532500.1 hypothetical protein JM18_001145 [Phytophthora kernoviae]RLN44311.1 hypothetical protein BBI17_001135 [Phytophthora kernoviae]
MGLRGCCIGCCTCTILTQLVVVACVLAIIPAAYLSYDYYLKPWGQEHYDEAVAAAQAVASRAASAAGDIDTSSLSCSDCLGVNAEFPISGMSTDYSTFQVLLMNGAGNVLTAITSSGVAFSGFAALSSTIAGSLTAASSVPPAKGGVFELLHMITQGQFITLLGSINLEGAPISYSIRNNRAAGGLFLAVFILGTTCLGLAMFGVFILSRHRNELVDHGTEEHEKKPFNHRYGSFYQDFTKENRYFFVAKMALDAASGAVVGAGNDPMVQLGLLVSFNALFIVLMIVRRPYLLRVFYSIGLSTSYLRIVMLLLTLVLVSPNVVKQRVRDLISQIIICINALVLLCLFARVGYVMVKRLLKWIQHRKEARPSQYVESADLLAIENGITAREQSRGSHHHHPQTPPLDGTPPSAHSYHQTTDRFGAWHLEGAGARTGDRRVV